MENLIPNEFYRLLFFSSMRFVGKQKDPMNKMTDFKAHA